MLIVWDMKKGVQLDVIPTYESLESIVALSKSVSLPFTDTKYHGSLYVATGGDRGQYHLHVNKPLEVVLIKLDNPGLDSSI